MLSEFRNEPTIDYGRPETGRRMREALEQVTRQLGEEYPIIIAGRKIATAEKIRSVNPSDLSEVVGFASKADRALAEQALQAAASAFESWRRVGPVERSRYLSKAAAIMRRRRIELVAWMVLEAGKTWPEADADVAEAIDFLEFYSREMVRLAAVQPLTRLMGEDNELVYLPLGVGVIIPPWNFPLAILAGMTSAAIVTGNAVVLKPASATPVIGAKFVEIMEEAGLPPGVLNFLPGPGEAIGDYLVSHPLTRFVSFTGSRDVGVRINDLAAKVHPGQKWLKRVVAEMGGKDAIIVDAGADLEDAVSGVVNSAFGFGGQKCSACSRAIILKDVYDEAVERIASRTKALVVGPAKDPGVNLGPVVDEGAYKKILEYIEIGKQEGRLLAGGGKAPGNGYFIQPTVFVGVDRKARIAQEEIFGPVLAVIKASDFDDALAIANDTDYGLTGSLYSRNRRHLEQARAEFHVGNLYFNRKCTGALVGVHPFGGFNLSGTDSKAGGRDYLLLFTQAKAISEKL